ncbi:MAG: Fic family protein [Chitinispirillia bacterium]|nr:Fic family protein [Chitinispirillia bacterium]
MNYKPPYEVTDEMLGLVSEISEAIGVISGVDNLSKFPRLRRSCRIKSIQSSLAIENNTLTFEQVSAILDGKKVLGPPNEIKEAENAIEAYKQVETVNPYSIEDHLKIHAIMMKGLIGRSGVFRTSGVGVFGSSGEVVHMAPPASRVYELMYDLFTWLRETKAHALIKSSIFHYEFEFIHPFPDGNGRMGRIWQTAILADWKPVFLWIPIESIILDRQQVYYNAIAESTEQSKCNPFIIFMLQSILQAAKEVTTGVRDHINHIDLKIRKLLEALSDYQLTAQEIMDKLGMKSRNSFRQNYLNPAIEAGLIGLTEPDKPTSRNQKYFKK